MSRLLCQQENGIDFLRFILIHKDCIEDSVHARLVAEDAHWPCPPSYLFEPSFDVVCSSYSLPENRVFKLETGEEVLDVGE